MKINFSFMILSMSLALSACSSQNEKTSYLTDMQTVAQYQQDIATKNTVSTAQKQKIANQAEPEMKLNASDSQVKNKTPGISRAPINIIPAVGLGYYHHYHW